MDPAEIGKQRERFIGTWRGVDPGPTLICVAALHGDEPAGVLALDRIFRAFEERKPRIKGDLVGIRVDDGTAACPGTVDPRFVVELWGLWTY